MDKYYKNFWKCLPRNRKPTLELYGYVIKLNNGFIIGFILDTIIPFTFGLFTIGLKNVGHVYGVIRHDGNFKFSWVSKYVQSMSSKKPYIAYTSR